MLSKMEREGRETNKGSLHGRWRRKEGFRELEGRNSFPLAPCSVSHVGSLAVIDEEQAGEPVAAGYCVVVRVLLDIEHHVPAMLW